MSTGRINSNPYIQQILTQNLTSSSIQPDQLKNSAKLLSDVTNSKVSSAAISSNGAKINNVVQNLRENAGVDAYSGFQNALSQVNSGSDSLKTIRFLTSASVLASSDSKTLAETFSNQNAISSDYGSSVGSTFTNLFTSTMEKTGAEGVAALNRGYKAVESADYTGSSASRSETVQKFFDAATEANLSGKETDAIKADLTRLAKGVESNKSADSVWNFFNDFIGSINV
jgi:hypothetical protein